MSFDYSGFMHLYQRIDRLQREMGAFLERFLLKQALDTLRKTKRLTPVDTGYLRNTWMIGNIQREGEMLKITIYNTTEYAAFIEYGHLTRDRMSWKRGYFMCTLSIKEVERRMPTRFRSEFATFVAGLGMEIR